MLLVLFAIVTVTSGVAMVSAYEAHMVNVTAHIENAMYLGGLGQLEGGSHYSHDFGTVFPEEWLLKRFTVRTSTSFCGPGNKRMKGIDYSLYVVPKDGYKWLGDALYFTVAWDLAGNPAYPQPSHYWAGPGDPGADDMKWVGEGLANPEDKPATPINVLSGGLLKPDLLSQEIIMGLDVPVFRDFWNEYTDVDEKPSGKSSPTVVIEKDDERHIPTGVDLGAEIKIQIIEIYPEFPKPKP